MTNVVFIHGLWISHTAWQPWIEHFAAQGHHAIAPAWPGEHATTEETRVNPGDQAGIGIDELTEHFAHVLEQFDTPPVVIGHSFGGLIAQKLLGQNKAAAAIAIDPAPIKGVKPLPIAQLRSAFPVLGNPLNRGRAKGLTEAQWRYGFGNALTVEESDALWQQWSIPSPGRPLFEAAVANFSGNSPAKVDTANATRGPLLITGWHSGSHRALRIRQGRSRAVRKVRCSHRLPRIRGTRTLAHDRSRMARRRRRHASWMADRGVATPA